MDAAGLGPGRPPLLPQAAPGLAAAPAAGLLPPAPLRLRSEPEPGKDPLPARPQAKLAQPPARPALLQSPGAKEARKDSILRAPATEPRKAVEGGKEEPHTMGGFPRPESTAQNTSGPSKIQKSFDQYEVLEMCGAGSYGEVYRAVRLTDGQEVALKRFNTQTLERSGSIATVKNEKNVFTTLRNKQHIVRYYHMLGDSYSHYLVLEYCSGGDLTTLTKTYSKIPPSLAYNALTSILSALSILNAYDLFHRDIKPANVLISSSGSIKLTDFGTCKRISNAVSVSTKQRQPTIMGTGVYIPPEVLEMVSEGPPGDIYALGIVLCYILTGDVPRTRTSNMRIENRGVNGICDANFNVVPQPQQQQQQQLLPPPQIPLPNGSGQTPSSTSPGPSVTTSTSPGNFGQQLLSQQHPQNNNGSSNGAGLNAGALNSSASPQMGENCLSNASSPLSSGSNYDLIYDYASKTPEEMFYSSNMYYSMLNDRKYNRASQSEKGNNSSRKRKGKKEPELNQSDYGVSPDFFAYVMGIKCSTNCKDFILRCLERDHEKRIGSKGYEEIYNHPYIKESCYNSDYSVLGIRSDVSQYKITKNDGAEWHPMNIEDRRLYDYEMDRKIKRDRMSKAQTNVTSRASSVSSMNVTNWCNGSPGVSCSSAITNDHCSVISPISFSISKTTPNVDSNLIDPNKNIGNSNIHPQLDVIKEVENVEKKKLVRIVVPTSPPPDVFGKGIENDIENDPKTHRKCFSDQSDKSSLRLTNNKISKNDNDSGTTSLNSFEGEFQDGEKERELSKSSIDNSLEQFSSNGNVSAGILNDNKSEDEKGEKHTDHRSNDTDNHEKRDEELRNVKNAINKMLEPQYSRIQNENRMNSLEDYNNAEDLKSTNNDEASYNQSSSASKLISKSRISESVPTTATAGKMQSCTKNNVKGPLSGGCSFSNLSAPQSAPIEVTLRALLPVPERPQIHPYPPLLRIQLTPFKKTPLAFTDAYRMIIGKNATNAQHIDIGDLSQGIGKIINRDDIEAIERVSTREIHLVTGGKIMRLRVPEDSPHTEAEIGEWVKVLQEQWMGEGKIVPTFSDQYSSRSAEETEQSSKITPKVRISLTPSGPNVLPTTGAISNRSSDNVFIRRFMRPPPFRLPMSQSECDLVNAEFEEDRGWSICMDGWNVLHDKRNIRRILKNKVSSDPILVNDNGNATLVLQKPSNNAEGSSCILSATGTGGSGSGNDSARSNSVFSSTAINRQRLSGVKRKKYMINEVYVSPKARYKKFNLSVNMDRVMGIRVKNNRSFLVNIPFDQMEERPSYLGIPGRASSIMYGPSPMSSLNTAMMNPYKQATGINPQNRVNQVTFASHEWDRIISKCGIQARYK